MVRPMRAAQQIGVVGQVRIDRCSFVRLRIVIGNTS